MIPIMYQILSILSIVSISTIIFILSILWALWILYVAMMNIERSATQNPLPWQAKLMVYPTMVVFDIIEFVTNVFVCTLIFLDLPREVTVSARLRRYYIHQDKCGWRMVIVNFIKPMLDPFDHKGPHI